MRTHVYVKMCKALILIEFIFLPGAFKLYLIYNQTYITVVAN